MTVDDIKFGTLALNNIKLDELIKIDAANGSESIETKRNMGSIDEKATGVVSPYISINGYNVTTYLINFSLNLSGFLPVINFTFSAAETAFISVNYPKDGDIVSVYMRAPGDFYKPFRMDFKILSVDGDVSSRYSNDGTDPNGSYFKFFVVAECYIPGLYTPKIKSFKSMSSVDVLLEVSQELNLGFSTNEKNTEDSMTWICPNYSYYDFIQEVSIRSYKDDESSFYDCWIDSYYNLNFANLGNQFSFSGDTKEEIVIVPGYTNLGGKADTMFPGTPTRDPVSLPLLLTNVIGAAVNPFMINGYTLTSRAGINSNEMGYITNIGFYDENLETDDPSKKYISYEIESLTTDNVPSSGILQKGRARSNDYKLETRREWIGILNTDPQNGEGVHKNYYHSKYQNIININDVTKMTLEVELNGYFPGIYRGQVVPVEIYVFDGGVRQQNVGKIPNRKTNTDLIPTRDEFLSGLYVVMGMHVTWSETAGGMKHILILSKRTWVANESGAIPKAFPISIQNRQF